jgi:DNA-binding MarR family transcriptional regulator
MPNYSTMNMTLLIDVEKLPRNVLETAIKLNDPLKNIYITLYCYGEPTAPKEIAKKLGHARAYVHMRLCQLESMGLAKKIYAKNRVKFEAIH